MGQRFGRSVWLVLADLVGNERSKAELVDRAVRGDRLALTMLLTDAEMNLRRRLAPKIPADMKGAFDADDLLQLIYSDVFRGISGFVAGGDDAFDRWFGTVAITRLRAEIRRHRAEKRGGGRRQIQRVTGGLGSSTVTLLSILEGRDRTPSRVAAGNEAVAAVQAALNGLPPDHRDAVRLVYLEGHTVAEAAQTLGRTERAIHNLCYKAKQKLRTFLGSGSRYWGSSD